MNNNDLKSILLKKLHKEAFKRSNKKEFLLASGKSSDYYINCRDVILTSFGMYLAGNVIYSEIKKYDIDIRFVGGVELGAVPLATAISFASGLNFEYDSTTLNSFIIRKYKKDHGISKWIEGKVSPRSKVVIVEDVVTTGESLNTAIAKALHYGLHVELAIALVSRFDDKDEEALFYRSFKKQFPNTEFKSIFTKMDFFNYESHS